MRKQYHSRKRGKDTIIWDIDKLVEKSKNFPVKKIKLADILELDEPYWVSEEDPRPTCRNFAQHAKLINEAELDYPIILSSDGRIMDGMHRVCKALILDQREIECVQFSEDPPPDYINVNLDELPY